MSKLPTVAALLSFALGAAVPAQAPQPAHPDTDTKATTEAHATRDAADWIRDLGSDDFRQRTQAERALRALGAEALPDLRKAVDAGGPEAQWRARRLIRQIERGTDGGLSRRDDGGSGQGAPERTGLRGARPQGWRWQGSNGDVEDRFEQLFRGLENDFGMDVPRGRFFADGFFQDLQEQMDALRQRMQSMPQGGTGRGLSMQMGPDGVRVEVKTTNEDGEEESKVYEAPDLESFRQQYPGVLEQHGFGLHPGVDPFGGGLQLRTFQFDDGPGFLMPQALQNQPRLWTPFGRAGRQGQDPAADEWSDAPAPVPPAGKRLGVVVRPRIAPEVLDYLGIDHGLMVEQVQDDTLASALELRAGDIVLEIGDRAIHDTGDVQDALGAIPAGSQVEVKVLRRGREIELKAAKPEAPAEPAPAPLQKRAANKDGGEDDGAADRDK
ncbi:MAG: PDZ domain-containing protein [Planctomycetota bacterium]